MKKQNRLLALITANKDKRKRCEILNADGTEATVYLYDAIDAYYGVNAQSFVRDFNAISAPTIHLRINSPGGDVFDGRAIATAISQHPSNVIAHVDGLAASAASYVAIAADDVQMAPGAFMMIHKAWTLAFGNAEDLLSTAALLEKIDSSLAADYAKKTGKSADQIEQWMSAETWFTAEEAVEQGFADSVSKEDDGDMECVDNAWDLSVFDNAPKPNAKKVKDKISINVECDPTQSIAALGKIEIAAKSALAAVESLNVATKKIADDEINEQAELDHACRVRRSKLL